MISKLLFVYNANSGRLSSLLDSAHKIISPGTSECQLCNLTFGVFKENELWARFRESLTTTHPDLKLEFLHRDEFEKQYWSKWLPKYSYPILLSVRDEVQDYNDGFGTNSGMDIFLSAEEMSLITETDALIKTIQERLKA
ncbi:GTPase [Nonlabens sp. Ci31]|uniref:GTPase n=1 Tax=Nonlabens sp. Ci31 TaxID=2608253 RepID=UPI0014641EB1|nr:GTPase [Nonlabens sp. Ci31]QJP33579.1 GTPase [Nonlabens sp. Ci31]